MNEIAARLAAQQHGLVRVAQLTDSGCSDASIRWLVQSGEWGQVSPEVLHRLGAPVTIKQRLLAAVWAVGNGAVVSHESAGWLWGIDACRPQPIHVVTDQQRVTRSLPGVRVRKVREVHRTWTTKFDNIPVVRPELLAVHFFADMHPKKAERLTEALWRESLFSGRSLLACLAQTGARGRNGIAGVRRYFEERGVDYVPSASGLELRLLKLLEEEGMSFRKQVNSGDEQWTARVDFRCETAPVIVEAYSEKYHLALADRRHDAERRRALEAAGFVVVEVWDWEVFHKPGPMLARIHDAVRTSPRSP